MRRRKTGRDGFQGYSPTAAAAWERIFGRGDQDPSPTPESPAEKSHKSERPCDRGKACYCTDARMPIRAA